MAKNDTGAALAQLQSQLSKLIDVCIKNLPDLMQQAGAKANDANAVGDVAAATKINNSLAVLTLMYQTDQLQQVKQIDDSGAISAAIESMTKINKDITAIKAASTTLTSFLTTFGTIVGGLSTITPKPKGS